MRYCKLIISIFIILLISTAVHAMAASIPLMIPYSGTIALKDGTLINGTGQFKFAIVNGHADCQLSPIGSGCTTYWSNDGTSTTGSEPTKYVSIPVSNGSFSVKLGDTSLTDMSFPLLGAYFTSGDTYLRIWFRDDISKEFELLPPDRQLVSVPYAYRAEVADTVNTVGTSVITDGAVTTAKIVDGAVTTAKIASNAIGSAQISDNSVASGDVGFNYAGSTSKGGAASDLSCTACVSQTELAFSITGDITGVAAGTGLTGGGTSGDVTLSIATDGVDTLQIKGGAVTSAKIAADAVEDSNVSDNISINNTTLYAPVGAGNVGIGTTSPTAPLHIAGGNWNPSDTEGDFKIGNETYRLKIGVATGGGGAGDVRIRSHGGTNRIMFGSDMNDILVIQNGKVGINNLTPSVSLDIQGDATQDLSGNGFVKAWARINSDGTVLNCYKCNSSNIETKKISTGTYEVNFAPLSSDITSRPRMAVIDSRSVYGSAGKIISLANRCDTWEFVFCSKEDKSSVSIIIQDHAGTYSDAAFTIFIY